MTSRHVSSSVAAGLETAMGFRIPATLLAAAAALLAASGAMAQTVKVRQAPPGAAIEVVYGTSVVATATADARGAADVVVPPSSGASGDVDAHLFVDECGDRRKVIVNPAGTALAPQEAACARHEIAGLFLVRQASTLVITLTPTAPSLLLRQGAFDPDAPPREWMAAPRGLVLSGGTGLSFIGNTGAIACGTVGNCSADGTALGFSGNLTYWFTPYLAADVGYLKPGDMTAEGTGEGYRFTSTLDSRVLTIGGRVGVPAGPVRFFGKAGADYHWATFSTSQTIDQRTITVGEATETIPGGTQDLALETRGWDWVFGGGLEMWFTRHFAIYAEFGRAGLKGDPVQKVEGALEDRALYLMVGASVRIGR